MDELPSTLHRGDATTGSSGLGLVGTNLHREMLSRVWGSGMLS